MSKPEDIVDAVTAVVGDLFTRLTGIHAATFPDQSIGGNSLQYNNIFNDTFNAKNVNKALKFTTGAGIKFVPVVGGLLSGLLSALWPDPENKGLVWEDIEDKMTEGLHKVMRDYLDQESGSVEKGQYFTSLVTALSPDQPFYFDDKTPCDNLAYFVSVGTLQLTVLREQHLFYSQIYGHEDHQAAKHKKDLEDAAKKYLTTRNQIVAECLKYHKDQIKEEWHEKDAGYFNANAVSLKNPLRKVDELFKWDDMSPLGKYKFQCRRKQFQTWLDAGYKAQVEALLSPSFSWPLYFPTPHADLRSENSAHPGWMGDGANLSISYDVCYFDHEDLFRKHGPITKVILHAGDRLDGIELWYGDQKADIRGAKSGYQQKTLELKTGEMITGLWANGGSDVLTAMKLSTTSQDGQARGTISVARDGIEPST
ncbi:uncharacterized protein FOBCDRAFT_281031 [Fusarium oxysporum Fo47]|uniref:Pesticidal crystal protein N-terminal domain-containing protein n=1 Tax=Fusarium oxysporum Fo47 TaxID=660027 RepID=W9JGZ6_FUSOX|nr:uncharacterized protein FOBCDRAFT_281031 [Fusarium oxysporum Fo47]EWZ31317.1 hypothetical protein FOZG_15723 [Fusarium oxysporum Fo47]QKD61402.2 hypothetical protein FOBCDRAFT_281031 [Fusarium oxysporum Fo47]